MDLQQDPAIEDFRHMVRKAIAEDLPTEMAERQKAFGGTNSPLEDTMEWTSRMNKRGWSVPHWPVEYGGTGWSPMQNYVFQQECASAFAPEVCWGATHMCGPVIYTFGSEALKEQFLPDFREGKYYICQGFSEPGNGSDLARLRTSARLEGDKYIVNGQKIWTSAAYGSDWGFFLVRTNPDVKPQAGISFLMIKMDTPGITVRQIPMINDDAELCEVFLDNVEVPAGNLVGEEGQGWTYAKFLLDHERTTSSFIFQNTREFARTRALAERETIDGIPIARLPQFQQRLCRAEAELKALEWSVLRELADEDFKYNRTAAASTLKVAGSRLQQTISELQMDILGNKATRFYPYELDERKDAGPLWPDDLGGRTAQALIARAATIYGGTLQVQKGIISKLAFGL
ncbi:MAG: acyl-CoA dehydrogenase family protein [Sphingomonadaceae bacterium]